MHKLIGILPLAWGSVISATISESTGVSLGLFVAGIIGTVVLVWRAGREWNQVKGRLKEVEDRGIFTISFPTFVIFHI